MLHLVQPSCSRRSWLGTPCFNQLYCWIQNPDGCKFHKTRVLLQDLNTIWDLCLQLNSSLVLLLYILRQMSRTSELCSILLCLCQVTSTNSMHKSISFQLKNVWHICQFINKDSCHQAVRALISSHLIYCKNNAARLVFVVGRRTAASLLFNTLHWLPVQQRVLFENLSMLTNLSITKVLSTSRTTSLLIINWHCIVDSSCQHQLFNFDDWQKWK